MKVRGKVTRRATARDSTPHMERSSRTFSFFFLRLACRRLRCFLNAIVGFIITSFAWTVSLATMSKAFVTDFQFVFLGFTKRGFAIPWKNIESQSASSWIDLPFSLVPRPNSSKSSTNTNNVSNGPYTTHSPMTAISNRGREKSGEIWLKESICSSERSSRR